MLIRDSSTLNSTVPYCSWTQVCRCATVEPQNADAFGSVLIREVSDVPIFRMSIII